ncbi:MAG TPA: GyrI-like domain-containing protein [Chitinophagaceae bacterium]|nr:GyrI-like domain-containing protein [Chitinophagaceae bacterium]
MTVLVINHNGNLAHRDDYSAMNKLDLAKEYKAYYTAKTKPELVHIEAAQYISICGKGDPSGQPFSDNIEALYSTAYTLKFAFKAKDKDFVVAKLEGLWWFDEVRYKSNTIVNIPVEVPRSEWEYRLLIRLPEFVTTIDLDQAIETIVVKKNLQLARQLEFYTMNEGKCVQMLHIGPFSTEPETLREILSFSKMNNLLKNGHHHEIYLSDFRKTESLKLKTIIREPVK